MTTFEDMTGNNVLPGSGERFPPQSLTGADPLKMCVLKSPLVTSKAGPYR